MESLAHFLEVGREVGHRWGKGGKVLSAEPSRLPIPPGVYLRGGGSTPTFHCPRTPGRRISHPRAPGCRAPGCSSLYLAIPPPGLSPPPAQPTKRSPRCPKGKALPRRRWQRGGRSRPHGARVSQPLPRAPDGELCSFGALGARAHAHSPPPGCGTRTPPDRK